jgi:hypothetical protein
MSLVKLAASHHALDTNDIKENYDDRRSFGRRNKGKLWGTTGLLGGLVGLGIGLGIGHHFDRKRRKKDFYSEHKKHQFVKYR